MRDCPYVTLFLCFVVRKRYRKKSWTKRNGAVPDGTVFQQEYQSLIPTTRIHLKVDVNVHLL